MSSQDRIDFDLLDAQLVALAGNARDKLGSSAVFVAMLFDALPDINWLGIYVSRGDTLVLGPFQGKPACIRIPLGQGVCGSAAQQMKNLCIDDVSEFDGHIACDAASKSELVVPLFLDRRVVGVLDIDSPLSGRFSTRDQQGIDKLCRTFEKTVIEHSAQLATTDAEFI